MDIIALYWFVTLLVSLGFLGDEYSNLSFRQRLFVVFTAPLVVPVAVGKSIAKIEESNQ